MSKKKIIIFGVFILSVIALVVFANSGKKTMVVTPVFTKQPGKYRDKITVGITCPTPDVRIFFTVDGKEPSYMGKQFSEDIEIELGKSITIKAIAIKSGYADSKIAVGKYEVKEQIETPSFSMQPGSYQGEQSLFITCNNLYKTYYTLDGTIPTEKSLQYSNSLMLPLGNVSVKAITVSKDETIDSSEVATAEYNIEPPQLYFSPMPGQYSDASLFVTVSGANNIYYTIDGREPDVKAYPYSSGIQLKKGTTKIKARVIQGNYLGPVTEVDYTLTPLQQTVIAPVKTYKEAAPVQEAPRVIEQPKAPEEIFNIYKTYGGENEDRGKTIKRVKDGYILAGYSKSKKFEGLANKGGYDYMAIKINKKGEVEWQKMYGGTGDDYCYSVIQSPDGGYILAGYSASSNIQGCDNQGGYDCYIVKINSSGVMEWQKMYGGSKNDYIYSVDLAPDGGYILAGASNSKEYSSNGGYDILMTKLSTMGDIEWQKMYGGTGDDYSYSVKTLSNGYIFVGSSNSRNLDVQNKGLMDAIAIKTDLKGNIEWKNMYGGSKNDAAYSVESTKDSGYIVSGASEGDLSIKGLGKYDVYLFKINNKGRLEWNKLYGSKEDDYGYSVKETTDGKYIVSGFKRMENNADNIYVIKFSGDGSPLFEKTYEGMGNSYAYAIDKSLDGNYILLGHSFSKTVNNLNNKGDADYIVIKLNQQGDSID